MENETNCSLENDFVVQKRDILMSPDRRRFNTLDATGGLIWPEPLWGGGICNGWVTADMEVLKMTREKKYVERCILY